MFVSRARRGEQTHAETEDVERKDGAVGVGGIVGILLAVLVLLVAVIALALHRRRANEREQVRKFAGEPDWEYGDAEVPPMAPQNADDETHQEEAPREDADDARPGMEPDEDNESSAPSVWSDGSDGGEGGADEVQEDGEEPLAAAGLALAAMGTASTVTRWRCHCYVAKEKYVPRG